MATDLTPEISGSSVRRGSTLETVTKVAEAVLYVSGALVLVLGGIMWAGMVGLIGDEDQLIPIHESFALVLVLSLWTIAAIAFRAGTSRLLIAAAVGWSIFAAVFGSTQDSIVPGDWHWVVQVVHLMIGIGVIVCGRVLAVSILRRW